MRKGYPGLFWQNKNPSEFTLRCCFCVANLASTSSYGTKIKKHCSECMCSGLNGYCHNSLFQQTNFQFWHPHSVSPDMWVILMSNPPKKYIHLICESLCSKWALTYTTLLFLLYCQHDSLSCVSAPYPMSEGFIPFVQLHQEEAGLRCSPTYQGHPSSSLGTFTRSSNGSWTKLRDRICVLFLSNIISTQHIVDTW